MRRRNTFTYLLSAALMLFLAAGVLTPAANAAVESMLLGAASSQEMIDFSAVTSSNFSSYFTYNGETTSSLRLGGNIEAQIGGMWTGTSTNGGLEVRIIIDSNGNDVFEPFDWSDPVHPWNPPDGAQDGDSWTYTYPADYPITALRNTTVTITFNASCYCTDFPWDTWDQWFYEENYNADHTTGYWVEAGQLMNTWWSGRDGNWNMLPNGTYKVQMIVDENEDWVFDAAVDPSMLMVLNIETASITGTVTEEDGTTPIAGARVEAGSPMAWGETYTAGDGTFTISGLEAGTSYHLRVEAAGKVTYESQSDISIAQGATTVSAGTITMAAAKTITGTIELRDEGGNPAPFTPYATSWGTQYSLWVWIDGHNISGPGWGNTNVEFQDGDSSATFTINIPPPSGTVQYQLNVNADGYVATFNGQNLSSVNVEVGTNGADLDTIAPIVLTKAPRLYGTVNLETPVSEWRYIDVQAIDSTDESIRYWGWGNVNGYDGNATSTGTFQIDGISAGTYRLEVRVEGYLLNTTNNVVVEAGVDKNMGALTILEGSKITGTLTIQGDTTNLLRWEGDQEDPMYMWLDAWSQSGGWSSTQFEMARGDNQSVTYTIAGLQDGVQYEINSWFVEGYELVEAASNESPVMVSVSGTSTVNLKFKPYDGILTGTITNSIGADINKVVVEAKRPWDWLPPKVATVANGGLNATTGVYTINGLGTGDYVVKVGAYNGYIGWDGTLGAVADYNGEGFLIPDAAVGVVTQRTFVQDDAASPTILNVALQQGYSISGTIALSLNDPPCHDFGNGVYDDATQTFGAPNGNCDTNNNADLSEEIDMDVDVTPQPVMAMPMDMMFMGGEDPRLGMIAYDGTSGTYQFTINGLAPGAYVVMPPFSSQRISDYENGSSASGTGSDDGQETHHWTATPQIVVISAPDGNGNGGDVDGIGFTLGNGYTVEGRLTLPEDQTYSTAQGDEWQAYQWIGQLELGTPSSESMGHNKSVMIGDFNQGSIYSFKFNHVANGDYMLRFWTDNYVPGMATFTVNNNDTQVNLTIEDGANLVGKLIDADTGEPVTADDGVMVRCEAVPHVEGSWRETRDDEWAQSYIEDGTGASSDNPDRINNTPGKFHLTALPTGHKYVLVVETTNGKKTNGAKNYVGQIKAGIEIPAGATGDINVGTIALKEGTTIQGTITDSVGNPIPGIEVFATPSDTHDGSAEAEGISDITGAFTIYGISPDVAYYDLIAAERPDAFDDWGKQIQWGEKRKYNIAPGATDAHFTLYATTASLSGTITIPADAEFMIPFKDEAEFPATMVLLQRKGVIYKEILDGIEVMSTPAPDGATTTTYAVDNLVPGTFKAIFMNYGLPTLVIDDIVVAAGSNTQNVAWDAQYYAVSGELALPTGGYPTSADISGVLCMNVGDQSLTFGSLTKDGAGAYKAYTVPGLASGETYQLVFYHETDYEGTPDIFTVGSTFTVGSADIDNGTTLVDRTSVPVLMVQAIKDTSDTAGLDYNIGILSTAYLSDNSIVAGVAADFDAGNPPSAGTIYITAGGGTLSDIVLSGDKRNITATYEKALTDTDVTLTLVVHYGDDDTALVEELSFNVNTLAKNENSVSVYIPGQVKLGNGDASQIYVPAGSLDTSDDGNAIVSIEKTDEEPGSLVGLPASVIESRGIFSRTATRALPADATAAGDQYDFSVNAAGDSATVSIVGSITIQVQYDPSLTEEEVANLQIIHYVNGEWVVEDTNRTVDTENHTISVDVDSLSPFMPAVVRTDDGGDDGGDSGGDDGSASSDGGGSGGGGCFITTTATSASPMSITFYFCLLAVIVGTALGLRFTRKAARAHVHLK